MKRMTTILSSLAIGAGLAIAAPATGEFDSAALIAQVQNHEARITNVESDVKKLQDTTSTPPAEHVDVPVAQPVSAAPSPAPTPAATPAPAPVLAQAPLQPAGPTIINRSYRCETLADGKHQSYEDDTYSDGSVTTKPVGNGMCITD